MRRRILLVLAGAAILAGAAAIVSATVRDADRPGTVRVERGELSVTVEATGKLEAAVALEIGPPSVRDYWNYNLSWLIPEGTQVKNGEVIARFDATQIEDQLRDHRAELEKTLQQREKEERNLEVSLRQLRLDLVKAEGELKTVDLDLSVPEELVSSIEVEQARLRQRLAQRRVAFLKEKIVSEQELVRSKLELLDVKRAFTEGKITYQEEARDRFAVKAPVDGMVIYVPKPNGDRWEIGEGVWMLAKILQVADVRTLQVEANVLEMDAARIAPEQTAEITIDAMPGQIFHSRVAEIGQIVHERSLQDPSKVFDAILPLPGDTAQLRPGMGVKVTIETLKVTDRLLVPIEAVRASPDGTFVEVVERGRIERRAVVLGERDRRRVAIESGLAEGERVVVSGGSAG